MAQNTSLLVDDLLKVRYAVLEDKEEATPELLVIQKSVNTPEKL
jgi:hypothetical protein